MHDEFYEKTIAELIDTLENYSGLKNQNGKELKFVFQWILLKDVIRSLINKKKGDF